jgi:tRNA(Ile)-lysidine synthase
MRRENAFESAVSDALSRCPHDGILLAAVSGGADSTAMLLAAAAARDRLGFALHCLHVDHGIRSEAECAADAAAVRALCLPLKVPCHVVAIERGAILERSRVDGCGIEAAAREYRHAAWGAEARRVGALRVLVGHTQDDLLETALIRFLRGAGPVGLSAMKEERGIVFRPLLSRTRSEVLAYLSSRGVAFQTDSTNADPSYFRNRVRLLLVPLLEKEFPLWRASVASLVRTQADAAAFIAAESERRVLWQQGGVREALTTEAEAFFNQPDIVRQEALYAAVDRLVAAGRRPLNGGLAADPPKRPASEPRRSVIRRFASGGASSVNLGALRVEKRGGRVLVERAPESAGESGFSIVVNGPGVYCTGPFCLKVSKTPEDGAFLARLPAVLRPPAAEDRIVSGGISRPAAGKGVADPNPVSRIVVEDGEGIAALLTSRGVDEPLLLVRDSRKDRLDYAEFVFFSILLQRGYHA